jgi:hypothetical protein
LSPLKDKVTRGNGKGLGNLGGLNRQWAVKLVAVELPCKPKPGATWGVITPPFCCVCNKHS